MTFSFDLPPETDTVVDVGAVVVKLGDTTVTDAAVLGSEWPVKQFSVSITFTTMLILAWNTVICYVFGQP